MNPQVISAVTALALLSVLWPAHAALASRNNPETCEDSAINEMLKEDGLHWAVETNLKTTASSLESSFAGVPLRQDAHVPPEFHAELFIGLPTPREWFCFQQMAAEAKGHMEYGTLGSCRADVN